jgi:hypothetical protein
MSAPPGMEPTFCYDPAKSSKSKIVKILEQKPE